MKNVNIAQMNIVEDFLNDPWSYNVSTLCRSFRQNLDEQTDYISQETCDLLKSQVNVPNLDESKNADVLLEYIRNNIPSEEKLREVMDKMAFCVEKALVADVYRYAYGKSAPTSDTDKSVVQIVDEVLEE